MADRQGPNSKEHFQPLEKTIPIYIRAAPCNLCQNVSKKPSPWPAARDALPIIRGARANKLGALRGKTQRAPEIF
jgi:hypothetical protein